MAWQFGAATGDDVNYSTSAFGATGNICVIAGWWRPTTLTAGRHYWSVGGVWGGRVDATTSEIALKSDNATTDGEWVTSGLGMATGDFRFLCFLFTVANTGTLIQWRVWQGTLDTRPALVTINQVTAPVGNFTGNTSIVCGNLATSGTVAFQGEFSGPFWGLRSNNSAPDAII
jgi:hypothetical protein